MKCSKCNRINNNLINHNKNDSYYTCDLCFKTIEESPVLKLFNSKLITDEFRRINNIELISFEEYNMHPFFNKQVNLPKAPPSPQESTELLALSPPPPFQDISSEESISWSDGDPIDDTDINIEIDPSKFKSLGSVSFIHQNQVYKGEIDRVTGTLIRYKNMVFTSTNEWVKFISTQNI